MMTRRWVTGTPGNYQFGPALQGINRHRGDIALMRGIRTKHANHEGSSACFLSGDGVSGGRAKHPTLDQVIAKRNAPSVALGNGTILRSIQAGVGVKSEGDRASIVYAGQPGSTARQPAENHPGRLFDRVFSDLTSGSGGNEALLRRLDMKQTILDIHKADLDTIRAHAGREDSERLELHTDAIRTLERDIQDLRDGNVGTAQCSAPNRYSGGAEFDGNNFDRIAKAHCDIIGRAFACDATRVATLQLLFDGASGIKASFLGGGLTDGRIHDEMHKAGDSARKMEEWYLSVLGYLMDLLKVPDPLDPNGGNILDNTVILFGSPLANPAHQNGPNYGRYTPGEQETVDHPMLLAGGGGGYFKTGQYLDFRKDNFYYGQNDGKMEFGPNGHAFSNRLLVSVLNAFGDNSSQFGDPQYCQGGALNGGLLR